MHGNLESYYVETLIILDMFIIFPTFWVALGILFPDKAVMYISQFLTGKMH